MPVDERGAGFVQLNTPSSIRYTAGQTLSLSDLAQPRTRVECVRLPAALMTGWRDGIRQYVRREGFQPFAADAEAERAGEGPVLPALAAAAPRAAAATTTTTSAAVPAVNEPAKAPASPSHSSPSTDAPAAGQGVAETGGIRIMSHHKVSGVTEFVYPDYDGVLSGGIVPRVVVTAEEKAERAAVQVHYLSPLAMTSEELEAFEELQALWKSRARSHSVLGAQHRAVAGGTLTPGDDEGGAGERGRLSTSRQGGGGGGPSPAKRPRGGWELGVLAEGPSAREVLLEDEVAVDEATDDMLAEALRMADDLLQLS